MTRFLLLVSMLLVSACNPEQAAKLNYGTPASGFRFELDVPPTLTHDEIESRAAEFAESAGFPYRVESDPGWAERVTLAFENGKSGRSYRDLIVGTFRKGEKEYVYFHVSSRSLNFLTEPDWVMFESMRSEHLPRFFPGLELNVVRHPEEFTRPEDIQLFARHSGAALP